ncbi:MAG: helix-turn-helix transcriptional regulator [Caldiserica bacterium]|jgi:transcriptional regulator with XRE-family HTH domain|nr:helix-turn-helix transcriptional regulator [Caldisericota bacterium]MDH7562456.1 helix-turn-helix transcriptional regulator [Caldisericota bacterium]
MAQARDRIREIRLSKGLSQGQLAQILGYTPSTVSRIEQGVLKPSLKFLQKFSQAFGVSLSYLIDPQEPILLDEEGEIDLNRLEPGLRDLALDENLKRLFDVKEEEIKRLATVKFRAGSVDKQGYLSLLLFLRTLDRR